MVLRFFSGIFFLVALLFSYISWANPSERLEQLKMTHRFGIGLSGGGALAVMGIEGDVNVTENFSISGGLGTGIDFSTVMLKGRWFLMGEWVSPYLGLGISRWWTDGTTSKDIGPSVLRNKFLSGMSDYSQGFSVWILSPTLGVQFMHPQGFAISAEIQYLFKMLNFSNGTYAGLGVHWYF